ncbi:hypothetical protein ADN00_08480 [Ornatilinea apprima]|uniref:Uncharacterized protein n=1 Tax=Ornatilinea apprima TaxID=1134406 RepID=A0A0P6XRL5_9CHLR|nr:hypothetical protein ADN00_08480 [Ornatilinea apprima]
MDLQNTLEATLKTHFQPVLPDQGFVNTLRTKLITPAPTFMEPQKNQHALWLVFVGLASGLALVWILGLFRKWSDK